MVTFTSDVPVALPKTCGNTCCETDAVCYQFTQFQPEQDVCCPAGSIAAHPMLEGNTFTVECRQPRRVKRFCLDRCRAHVSPHCKEACHDDSVPRRCARVCRRAEVAACLSDATCFDEPVHRRRSPLLLPHEAGADMSVRASMRSRSGAAASPRRPRKDASRRAASATGGCGVARGRSRSRVDARRLIREADGGIPGRAGPPEAGRPATCQRRGQSLTSCSPLS